MEQWGIASSNIDVDAAASPARAHRGGVEEGGREYGLPGHRSSNGSNDRLLQKEVNISLLKILTRSTPLPLQLFGETTWNLWNLPKNTQ